MYTKCPKCSTVFRLRPEHLRMAEGKVRCGHCMAIFDARQHLTKLEETSGTAKKTTERGAPGPTATPGNTRAPSVSREAPRPTSTPAQAKPEGIDLSPTIRPQPSPPVNTGASSRAVPPRVPQGAAGKGLPDQAPKVTRAPDRVGDEPARPEEKTATSEQQPQEDIATLTEWDDRFGPMVPPKKRSLLGTIAWTLIILPLMALLIGQYAYFNKESLLRNDQLRPWLERICTEVGCTIPPRRDPSAFMLVERDVRFHPEYQQALLIDATFLNQAGYAQPYPEIEVVLKNVTGDVVAVRRFRPEEYLNKGQDASFIASGAEGRLVLEVSDPGADAVSFEFSFH